MQKGVGTVQKKPKRQPFFIFYQFTNSQKIGASREYTERGAKNQQID